MTFKSDHGGAVAANPGKGAGRSDGAVPAVAVKPRKRMKVHTVSQFGRIEILAVFCSAEKAVVMDADVIHIRYAASNGDTSALGAVFKRCQSSALLIEQKVHFSCRNRFHHHRNDRVLGRIILSSLHNTGIVMGLGAAPYDKTVPRLPRAEVRTAFADIGRICAGCFVVCAVKAYAGERLRLLHTAKRLTDCPGVGIGQIIVINLIGKDTNLSVKIRNGFFTDI